LNLLNHVVFRSSALLEFNDVTGRNVFKPSKKTIPVARYADIPWLPNLFCSPNSPNPAIQSKLAGVIENRHLKTDLGDPKNRERLVFFCMRLVSYAATRLVAQSVKSTFDPKIGSAIEDMPASSA